MERSHPTVLAICGDPGGANAVAPVLDEIVRTGAATVIAFAYREAFSLWKKRGIRCEKIPEESTDRSIREILKKENPSLLLTGSSLNPACLEKKFIAAARDRKIPSLTVLDFWSNYRIRFSDDSGRLVFVPDIIAVMDETAFDDMVAGGFDPGRLVITGQPLFDDLASHRRQYSPSKKNEIRSLLGISRDALVVLFASQPISSLYGSDSTNPLFPGYTEKTVLRSLIRCLEQICNNNGRELVLLIRPHPREQNTDYGQFTSRDLRIIISEKGNGRDIALTSDLVTGMSSVFLVEASYLGCRVISIQPGLRFRDPLPTNRTGLSTAVYSESDLLPTIQKVLNELPQTKNNSRNGNAGSGGPDRRSARKILDLILLLIRENYKESA